MCQYIEVSLKVVQNKATAQEKVSARLANESRHRITTALTAMIVLFEEVTTVPLRKTKTPHFQCPLLSQQYKAQSICKQIQLLTELNVIDVLTKMHLRQF